MCGIAGFAGSFDEGLLEGMSARISHRGPDDSGTLLLRRSRGSDQAVGLVHRRLSIIDLSAAGRQPMEVRCATCGPVGRGPRAQRLWLTYNGELYNYRELRDELEARGHTFFSRTDSEVLLHLYAEEGPAMLKRLNGIFAFALYDGRASGQKGDARPGDLLLARDGFGVKPLYFAETARGLLFGSELKALLAAGDIDRTLDHVAIHHYMTYLWCPAPRTALAGVRKFEPGEAMLVRGGRIAQRWFFYDIPYGAAPLRGDDDEIAAEVAERLRVAVERQLVADVQVGAFLSGGLDSSAIVAMMRRIQPDTPVPCYCIGFRDGGTLGGHSADLPYATRVAKHLGVDIQPIEIGPEIISHLPELLFHLDEPQVDAAPINSLLIARRARQDGLKVLMSGQGGDDIFTGYRRHRALRLERLWGWLPRCARKLVAVPARAAFDGRSILPGLDGQRARQLARGLAHIDLPGEERLIAYFYWGGERLRRSLYAPDVRSELRDVDTAEPLRRSLRRLPGGTEPINRMLYLEARHFLADHNLNYTDKTSMAAGVEVRVPLLDPDLVAYAARIPVAAKMRRGVPKAIFKRAMEPYLPFDVVHRPKTGFGAPIRRWLKNELRGQVEELLSERSVACRGLFDPAAVRRLVELDRARKVDGAYAVFGLMCVELWCRTFVDRAGHAPLVV